jgi:hypothetical protein
VFREGLLPGRAQAVGLGARRGCGRDRDELSVTDGDEGPGGPERHVLFERVAGELQGVANGERRLLDPADDGEERSGRIQSGRGAMAPTGVDRLAVDEALDEVAGRSAALRADAGLFAQVGLGGLRGDDVDRLDRRPGEREAGRAGDPQARGLVGARVPIGEKRDAVGVDEDLEADPLMHAARGELAQEPEVFAPDGRALRERPGEQLDCGGRARA